MKRTSVIIILTLFALNAFGQKSVDRLFEKYSGNDGYVYVTFSGNILNLLRSEKDDRDDHWPGNVTEFRILAQEDDHMNAGNFYDLAEKELNTSDYEEFMSVKESHQDIRMYVRTEGKIIHEILLIGGGEDNFIIQFKGKITLKEAEDLSADVKKDHGKDLYSDLN